MPVGGYLRRQVVCLRTLLYLFFSVRRVLQKRVLAFTLVGKTPGVVGMLPDVFRFWFCVPPVKQFVCLAWVLGGG